MHTERSLTSVKVAVVSSHALRGSPIFCICFPKVCPKGGESMNYITLTELVQILTLLIVFATFILSFHNNKKR